MAAQVKVTNRLPQWIADQNKKNDVAALTMATDIHRVASLNAPVDTGLLVRSGRINRKGTAHYSVSFGNFTVRYARRRHFENKKNPGTLRYLQRAGDSIARNFRRYLGATR